MDEYVVIFMDSDRYVRLPGTITDEHWREKQKVAEDSYQAMVKRRRQQGGVIGDAPPKRKVERINNKVNNKKKEGGNK